MKQKKLMLLGGIRYLLPAINAAHRYSTHDITLEYLLKNRYSTYTSLYN